MRLLAESLGLQVDIEAVRRTANRLAVLLLAVGALLASSIVTRVLGKGRTLNAAAAFGVTLLPNLVGLPLWIVAVVLARRRRCHSAKRCGTQRVWAGYATALRRCLLPRCAFSTATG